MSELSPEPATAESWLVFGASGSVGRFLLPQLEARGVPAIAVSRQPPRQSAPEAHVRWVRADLVDAAGIAAPAVVVSLGPLDGFAAWLARAQPQRVRRVLALSSTSVVAKADSDEASERALARRMHEDEEGIADWSTRHGASWTVLRPTLIYGGGTDRNLSRLAAIARRWGFLPLPACATGRRQPVHAEDVARAVLAAVDAPDAANRRYDIPGGETLSYRDMVERVLGCLPHRPRLVVVPDPISRPLFALASRLSGTRAVFARMREDLVFADEDAARDFGYAPRAFRPEASMFS